MADLKAFPLHPQRGRVLSELHARPFAAVQTPSRVLRVGFTTQPDLLAAATAALAARCDRSGLPAPPLDARHVKVDFPEGCFQFERHNEFVTYTWIVAGSETPFSPSQSDFALLDWLPAPGLLIVAADVHVVPAAAAPEPASFFAGASVASASVNGGRAIVATDFRADSQGFVRILVGDHGLDALGAALLVQTLLETETYRSLALLGLPEALSCGAEVEKVEKLLPTLMKGVQQTSGVAENRALLDRITALSADVETLSAESSFRFGATRAYAQLLTQRLEMLQEAPLPQTGTLDAFLSRRFTPAIRTCASVEARLSALSSKIERTTALLRTRVDVDLEAQNAIQLQQMSDRLRLQIRLQQAVEGLSVVAITYYCAGLAHYVFDPLEHSGWPIRSSVATAITVPIVAAAVALVLWRARKAH